MEIRRGDLVIAAFPGDYGKPRPALVVQADGFGNLPSLTMLPLTTEAEAAPLARINIVSTPANGLLRQSDIMVDKVMTLSRTRIRQRIGQVDAETMDAVGLALAAFLGLG